MNRITEDLLALAGVESPDYKLALQPTRASALVQDAIDSLGGIVVDSGVTLESAGAPDALVLADPDAMNQVFGNLVENALRYGKSGKRILVGARLLESEVEFSVRDFGPGIASEHLTRIFERFYRVDKARSRESGGTGLGLAIVKHIVLAHGGRIWAESELGPRRHVPLHAAPGARRAAGFRIRRLARISCARPLPNTPKARHVAQSRRADTRFCRRLLCQNLRTNRSRQIRYNLLGIFLASHGQESL